MRTLLVGNTGYITNKFVEEAFPESLVMVMGDTSIRKNRKTNLFVRPFVKNEKELKDIFSTYDFEQIIYFSNYLSFHGETYGEAEMLRKILQLCRGKRNMRILCSNFPFRKPTVFFRSEHHTNVQDLSDIQYAYSFFLCTTAVFSKHLSFSICFSME